MNSLANVDRPKRSVSQLKQYERCPYSYYLARTLKVWQRPAAWLPQGSAVHTVAEVYEKRKLQGDVMSLDEAQDLFGVEYAKEVGRYTEVTPNFEYWFRSGPYAGDVDVERRFKIGKEQVEKFINYTESHAEEVIWISPDGTPGIELAFDIDLDGIAVRGFIDAVIEINGAVQVVDYKTGNSPGDDFQLGVYGVAIAEMFGVEPPQTGTYWMGRTGKHTFPYQIGEWTRERVSEKFRELEDNIQQERFDPKPDPKVCGFCDVNLSCEYSLA